MLRSPPFNVQADYLEEVGARGVAWFYPREIPASHRVQASPVLQPSPRSAS